MEKTKKKVLMIATVPSMIGQFNMDNIKILQSLGYEVHVGCNFGDRSIWTEKRIEILRREMKGLGIHEHQIDFSREPGQAFKNLRAYRQLVRLVNSMKFAFIHCHTPVASAMARVAAHRCGVKIIYTTHGFHFYDGAPLKNWILYYPVEKFLGRWTNVLITINKQDYRRGKTKFKAGEVYYIPGTGVDTEKFSACACDILKKRRELYIPQNGFVITSVGEINDNKNHETIIRAIGNVKHEDIHYLICGIGEQVTRLSHISRQLGIRDRIHFLGYRSDIDEILHVSDVFAFPSKREGLGVAAIEAMAAGLPLITSNAGGIPDYSIDGKTGFTHDPMDVKGFAASINWLYENPDLRWKMGELGKKHAKRFDISRVSGLMRNIYGSM